MSENLNDVVEEIVSDAEVMTVPIDDTLTISGEAADAKAVGDALALKADASSVVTIDVNGESADNQGHIIIDGGDIKMSSSDNTTLKDAIESAAGRTGAEIPISDDVGADTVKDALEAVDGKTANDIMMASGSETSVAAKISAMDVTATANSNAITALQAKAGDTIMLETGGSETIKEIVDQCVKSVNGEEPDETGNVQVQHALTADNLTSNGSQSSAGEWNRRTSGGSAPIADGKAWLSNVRGNRSHIGYVPEVLNMTVTPAPREQGEDPITAEIDRDAFVAAATSGTYNFVYTTSWSVDPATYGITVSGTPVSGDQIVVNYTAEDRGTIIQSDPQTLVSTGWNLYNHEAGYAIGLKYKDTPTFKIEGTYTAVKYSSTSTGTKTTLTPSDGIFTIPANGYIWVEGGNATDTAVYMTWDDWVLEGPAWEAYSESVVDLSDVMETCFPYGLLRAGDIRDEINLNTGMAISNVQRMAYSAENLAAAIATGRSYEYDTDYIYLERATAVSTEIELEGEYDVSDHGLEYFTGTSIACYAVVIYGNNLKNKLERDVVTISGDLVDNLTTNDATKALTAKQGKVLNDYIGSYTYALHKDKMIPIQSDTDLDDLKTPGSYFCQTSSIAATLLHSPVLGSGFSLHVEALGGASGQYIVQTVKANNSNAPEYKRYQATGDWQTVINGKLIEQKNSLTSRTLIIPNNARLLIISPSSTPTSSGFVILCGSSNAGAVSADFVYKGSNMSLNTSTANRLTINSSSSVQFGPMIIVGTQSASVEEL